MPFGYCGTISAVSRCHAQPLSSPPRNVPGAWCGPWQSTSARRSCLVYRSSSLQSAYLSLGNEANLQGLFQSFPSSSLAPYLVFCSSRVAVMWSAWDLSIVRRSLTVSRLARAFRPPESTPRAEAWSPDHQQAQRKQDHAMPRRSSHARPRSPKRCASRVDADALVALQRIGGHQQHDGAEELRLQAVLQRTALATAGLVRSIACARRSSVSSRDVLVHSAVDPGTNNEKTAKALGVAVCLHWRVVSWHNGSGYALPGNSCIIMQPCA